MPHLAIHVRRSSHGTNHLLAQDLSVTVSQPVDAHFDVFHRCSKGLGGRFVTCTTPHLRQKHCDNVVSGYLFRRRLVSFQAPQRRRYQAGSPFHLVDFTWTDGKCLASGIPNVCPVQIKGKMRTNTLSLESLFTVELTPHEIVQRSEQEGAEPTAAPVNALEPRAVQNVGEKILYDIFCIAVL